MKATEAPLKFALVGLGRAARHHLMALRVQQKKGRVELIAVADANQAAADKALHTHAKAYFKDVPIYASLGEILEHCPPDVVAITTPSGSHKALAMEALAAGCHLLVEKPIAMSSEDAREICEAAEKAGKRVALGHVYRYFPLVDQVQHDLRNGRFGRIYYGTVQVRWGHDQAYYDSAPWRGTRAADGGVVMNQSVHALDLMRWLLCVDDNDSSETSEAFKTPEILGSSGATEVSVPSYAPETSDTSKTPETTVKAFCDRQSHRMESEDLGLALFRFGNGSYLSYEGTTSSEPAAQEASFYICAEKGEIRARLYRKKISCEMIENGGKRVTRQYVRRWLGRELKKEGLAALTQIGNPHYFIYSDLIEAICENRDPRASARDGLASVAMVEAVYRDSGIL
ncbi:MAG: Gfo/Idh/MocA family oxidoreductase [Clostridiales bacterium]|nr:Gfo/Idh/MocA family oxidoreductase [Clostridiales bacterium]MDD7431888.1 Gfo/Idh/MocA family oxidoreductase [Clostridiales bacterium]MDY3061610.1 Gfo/Idh/MocA family oxidoreductase [Eubacteriales bacterium]